jgi:hypothetical protein
MKAKKLLYKMAIILLWPLVALFIITDRSYERPGVARDQIGLLGVCVLFASWTLALLMGLLSLSHNFWPGYIAATALHLVQGELLIRLTRRKKFVAMESAAYFRGEAAETT